MAGVAAVVVATAEDMVARHPAGGTRCSRSTPIRRVCRTSTCCTTRGSAGCLPTAASSLVARARAALRRAPLATVLVLEGRLYFLPTDSRPR